MLVAIKIEQSSALYRELENRIPESSQAIALDRIDRATDIATHRLKHHLKRHPGPEWVPVPSTPQVPMLLGANPSDLCLSIRIRSVGRTSSFPGTG
jgi:hypothetical protein